MKIIGQSTNAVPCRITSFFGSKYLSPPFASSFFKIASSTISRIITQQVATKSTFVSPKVSNAL